MLQNRKPNSFPDQQTAIPINTAIDDILVIVYCILNKICRFECLLQKASKIV